MCERDMVFWCGDYDGWFSYAMKMDLDIESRKVAKNAIRFVRETK